jgi:phenylpropionate dioxygenase-like ring-hydroxylating dioxygenase large terminal subunit
VPGRAAEILGAGRLASAREPLGRATTLPAEAFTSPEVYALEVERILSREWLCAGRADQVPEPGDYLSLDLLGEKLLVVRGGDGRIRALSRVCRHRGAVLVNGAGNARSFQCPYHAWTYRLDGRLVGAPYMEGAEGFDRSTCRLPEIRSELWQGWIFVNLDADAPPLAPRLEPLAEQLEGYRMSEMVAVQTAVFDSPFNWKVLVDNFMEAYHHIAIHRDTFEPVFPAERSYTPEASGPYSLLVMPGEPGPEDAEPGLPVIGDLDAEQRSRLVATVVFPFHLFAPSAELLTWYQLLPLSVDRFELRIYTCVPRAVLEDPRHRQTLEGIQAFVRHIHEQDIQACEATWAGLGAPSYAGGVLAPLEKSIWQFNQWWIERMTGGAGRDE